MSIAWQATFECFAKAANVELFTGEEKMMLDILARKSTSELQATFTPRVKIDGLLLLFGLTLEVTISQLLDKLFLRVCTSENTKTKVSNKT
jgi:hypothetical protein